MMVENASPGNWQDMLVDPERMLAVSYAPARTRVPMAVLFAIDERMGAVVARTTEAGIGLIRLAWWREALTALDTQPAPPEPLLAAAAREILPRGITGAMLAEIEHGWSALLAAQIGEDEITRFGRCRGGMLFDLAGRLLGSDDPRLPASGEGWALADLVHRHSDPAVRVTARRLAAETLAGRPGGSWPRAARPLAGLAALAARDVAVDAPRRQGSPGRVARMLALRLTGR